MVFHTYQLLLIFNKLLPQTHLQQQIYVHILQMLIIYVLLEQVSNVNFWITK